MMGVPDADGANYSTGKLDQVIFWNRALNQTDIDNLYNFLNIHYKFPHTNFQYLFLVLHLLELLFHRLHNYLKNQILLLSLFLYLNELVCRCERDCVMRFWQRMTDGITDARRRMAKDAGENGSA